MPSNASSRATDPAPGRDPIVAQIWHTLSGLGDPERAVQQQAYMKSDLPFRGISAPQLRTTLKPILSAWTPADANAWENAIRDLWDNVAYREEWYAAIVLLRHRPAAPWLTPDRVPLLRHLISTGAWWDVVDEISTHPLRDLLDAYPVQTTSTIRQWAHDDDLWLRRAAVLSQIGRRERTDLALLTNVLQANLLDRTFWLRKAIGWSLRDYAKHDADWVRGYVETHRGQMAGLTRREALKGFKLKP